MYFPCLDTLPLTAVGVRIEVQHEQPTLFCVDFPPFLPRVRFFAFTVFFRHFCRPRPHLPLPLLPVPSGCVCGCVGVPVFEFTLLSRPA